MSQFFDSFIFLFGGLLLIGGLLKLGSVLGGKRAPWLAVVLPILGVAGAVAGGSWALDHYGTRTHAPVVGKTEWATLMQNGSYLKSYSVTIKQRSAATGETVNLRTDQRLFDDLAVGDSAAVRSLRVRPSFARLEPMTGERWLGIVIDSGFLLLVLGVSAVFAGIFLYGGTGATGSARKAVALALLGVGGFSCWRDTRPYRGEPEPRAPTGSAQAKVTRLRSVNAIYPVRQGTASRGGWRLEQPYQVVEAAFTPAGAKAPVVGVDAIDEGSIPHLEVGRPVELTYDRARPRTIRLNAGTRNWSAVNARSAWLGLGVIAALMAGLLFLRIAVGRRKVVPRP